MKSTILLTILAAGSVVAGEKAPIFDKNPVIPPAPSLYSWFAGGTVGYLIENEEEMYTVHLGVDLPSQLGSWDQAIYLEVGYTEIDGRISNNEDNDASPFGRFLLNNPFNVELEIIPITLNYKLERPLTQSLNTYIGIGAGVALVDAKLSSAVDSDSDDDTVFFAQAFGGVLYNVNPSFELFARARVIYLDEPEFSIDGTSFGTDDLNGFDFETTDVLVEVGGRVNF